MGSSSDGDLESQRGAAQVGFVEGLGHPGFPDGIRNSAPGRLAGDAEPARDLVFNATQKVKAVEGLILVFSSGRELRSFLILHQREAGGRIRGQLRLLPQLEAPSATDFDRRDRHIEWNTEREDRIAGDKGTLALS